MPHNNLLKLPTTAAGGGAMASALWILAALCIIPRVAPSPLPHAPRDPQRPLVAEAVAAYNKESASAFVFGLLEDQTESEETNGAHFTIKETVCLKSHYEEDSECAFKAGGVEKLCSVVMEDHRFIVICSSGTSHDGGGSGPSGGEKDPAYPRERIVIIRENSAPVLPPRDDPAQRIGEHEDDYDDDATPDIVIQFHNDHQSGAAAPPPEGEKRRPVSGVIRGRILCLECMFDIFPRK